MGKLIGRRARYGWRDEINGNPWWKIKEHKRIRQIENKEWQDEALVDLANFIEDELEVQLTEEQIAALKLRIIINEKLEREEKF